jgi:hypothetical protein
MVFKVDVNGPVLTLGEQVERSFGRTRRVGGARHETGPASFVRRHRAPGTAWAVSAPVQRRHAPASPVGWRWRSSPLLIADGRPALDVSIQAQIVGSSSTARDMGRHSS